MILLMQRNIKIVRSLSILYLESADEDRKAAVRLKGSHIQIGNEVHNTHCPCHKGDLVLFIAQELDHLNWGNKLIRLRSW